MSSNLLVAKAIGGIAAVGTASTGGYFAYKYDIAGIKKSFNSNNEKANETTSSNENVDKNDSDAKNNDLPKTNENVLSENPSDNLTTQENIEKEIYLLSLVSGPQNNVQTNDDLYLDADKNTKNYQCKLFSSPNTVDTSCELFSLSIDEGSQYFGDLKKINETNMKTTSKVVLRENTFYKLIVNKGEFTKNFEYGQTYINLQSKNNGNKIFAQLKVLAKLNGTVTTDKKWVLAKATSKVTNSQTDFSNFSCQIGLNDKKSDVNCSVSTLSKTTLVSLNKITTYNTNPLENLNAVIENSYYIIDFSDEHTKTNITDEKLKQKIVFTNSTNSNEKIDFEFTSYLSGVFDKSNRNNNKIFVLKDLSTAK